MSVYAGKSFITFCLLLIVGCSVCAQSGRRAPKSQPSPQATPSQGNDNSQQLPLIANSPAEVHRVKLLIARQRSSKHLMSEDTISASFLKRLNEFTGVTGSSFGELKREEAIKRARSEAESFVVLLQFEIDNFQEGRIVLDSPDLEVKYFVYAPRSGQLQTKGKVYYQAIGGAKIRKDNWPEGPPIKITAEAAGIETADRLHDWLTVVQGMPHHR
jgi:hypothetical protein